MKSPRLVHFAPYGWAKTLCGLPQLRNGLPKTDDWSQTTCPICLREQPK